MSSPFVFSSSVISWVASLISFCNRSASTWISSLRILMASGCSLSNEAKRAFAKLNAFSAVRIFSWTVLSSILILSWTVSTFSSWKDIERTNFILSALVPVINTHRSPCFKYEEARKIARVPYIWSMIDCASSPLYVVPLTWNWVCLGPELRWIQICPSPITMRTEQVFSPWAYCCFNLP